ncbi:MAG: hypothetical protein APU95_03995 [Hadesarchaea archaeon YNP_N21]|jgi:hypothetical protein|nr:MAG: hypothetical protein APU95_03995 [Hadesarchaea archaeon YNP_N21]
MLQKFPCPICGGEMHELKPPKKLQCYFCGEIGDANLTCEQNHFICETCRLATAQEIIERIGISAREADPIEIANKLMVHPAIPVYGIEHHSITAVALFRAVKNLKGEKVEKKDIKKLLALTQKIPYGSCGFLGVCGAAAGVGAALSALLKASYMSDRERTLAMNCASEANIEIAEEGGPRCCIESVYIALDVASRAVNQIFGLKMNPKLPIKSCKFPEKAPDCRRERCKFFPVK